MKKLPILFWICLLIIPIQGCFCDGFMFGNHGPDGIYFPENCDPNASAPRNGKGDKYPSSRNQSNHGKHHATHEHNSRNKNGYEYETYGSGFGGSNHSYAPCGPVTPKQRERVARDAGAPDTQVLPKPDETINPPKEEPISPPKEEPPVESNEGKLEVHFVSLEDLCKDVVEKVLISVQGIDDLSVSKKVTVACTDNRHVFSLVAGSYKVKVSYYSKEDVDLFPEPEKTVTIVKGQTSLYTTLHGH